MSFQASALPSSAPSLPERPPQFETERFIVAPMSPQEANQLLSVLFQDPLLAEQLPCMQDDRSKDAALREAFGIQLQCAAGQVLVWGIVERDRRMLIGAVLARSSLSGNDVEVLVASKFWNCGVADEAGQSVVEWLEDHPRINPVIQ